MEDTYDLYETHVWILYICIYVYIAKTSLKVDKEDLGCCFEFANELTIQLIIEFTIRISNRISIRINTRTKKRTNGRITNRINNQINKQIYNQEQHRLSSGKQREGTGSGGKLRDRDNRHQGGARDQCHTHLAALTNESRINEHGGQREATGGHGKQREATRSNGKQREATGSQGTVAIDTGEARATEAINIGGR